MQGDANFLEENIAEGVTIWGKTGTHQGGNSSGQYAWKKTEKTTTGLAGNVNFTTTDTGAYTYENHKITATSTVSGLVSALVESDCIGLNLVANSTFNPITLTLQSGGSITYKDVNGTVPIGKRPTWSYAKGVITINFVDDEGSWGAGSFEYTGSKYINKQATVTNFINFVVSDNSSEYPSSGQHTDGYYYSSISQ